jgi:GAF domain-containing protein/HAMP domain-containing protein
MTARSDHSSFSAFTASIRTRLVVFLILFTVLPLALAGIIASLTSENSARQKQEDSLSAVATLKEGQVTGWIEDLYQNLYSEAERTPSALLLISLLQSPSDPSNYQSNYDSQLEIFKKSIAARRVFDELFLIDARGNVILSTDNNQKGKNLSDQAFFQNGLQRPYFNPPYFDTTLGRMTAVVAIPLATDQGQVMGVVAGRANLDQLHQIMLERTGFGETGETYLVGADGLLLTETLSQDYPVGKARIQSEGVQKAILDHQNGVGGYLNYQGLPVYGAFRWIPELQAALIAEQSQAEAAQASTRITNILIAAMGISILLAILAAWVIGKNLTRPLNELTETAEKIAAGNLTLRAKTAPPEKGSPDEIAALAIAFNSMIAQLRNLVENLEERAATRTRQLQNRSEQLTAAAEVGRSATTILDKEQLIQHVVDLIQERFNLYYVGLFLVDEAREWAVLQAGTGLAGQTMLARSHRLPVSESSMIGWSITNGQARIALEAGEDPVRLATPELPRTRSEAAIPLRSRGQILGALTIQSEQPGAFDRETTAIFQVMADQVAVALDNASLFDQAQQAIETVRQAYGETSRKAWLEKLQTRPIAYRRDAAGVSSRPGSMMEMTTSTTQTPAPVEEVDSHTNVVIPIVARGQTIGLVNAQRRADLLEPQGTSGNGTSWTNEEVSLLENLIDQLGIALESARLFESTQQQAERERLVAEVTSRIRATLDIDTILQTSVLEMRDALDLAEVEIRLGTVPNEKIPSGGH